MKMPVLYSVYFCNFANAAHSLRRMGWERFNEKITKVDASFTTGTMNYEYKPIVSLLTVPHDPFFDGLVSVQEPDTCDFHIIQQANKHLHTMELLNAENGTMSRGNYASTIFNDAQWKRIFGRTPSYLQELEMGQYICKTAYNGIGAQIQPSVHVGIYPVHRLTTTTNSIVPTEVIDVGCTWDF